ncbi:glutamyl-Q tRNA(Asp) synthetase [mine drainage metagenome]|uniref:Glutamyl-Q tRNA(Asp) synthetase n=1 Tax=mine drainage metagenome TaxID=410659 RepID=A0A1J5QGY9_9ZZZZ
MRPLSSSDPLPDPMNNPYRGRFAPSPTGPLHIGSLIAAVGSFLEARRHDGAWLVRMEDLDPPREMPGAAEHILRTLEVYGFEWDGPVLYQNARHPAYEAALEILAQRGLLYPCACTRREIADSALRGIEGRIYPGTCRNGLAPGKSARAWRVKVHDTVIAFDDAVQGHVSQNLTRDIGDFVLKRADGLFAYQLAVVVDDAMQGITHVVRGADLLDSTPRQIYLQRLLGLRTPHYAHLPVAANARGEKLSKQTRAVPLDLSHPVPPLWQALNFLGQRPPDDLTHASLTTLWQWARESWQLNAIAKIKSIML